MMDPEINDAIFSWEVPTILCIFIMVLTQRSHHKIWSMALLGWLYSAPHWIYYMIKWAEQ